MANDVTQTSNPRARKAAPRKAAASAGRRTTGKATTETLAAAGFPAAPAAAKADTITFLGRTMTVQMPTPEQLVVWQRLARKVGGQEAAAAMDRTPRDGETQEQANARANDYASSALDRMLKLVTSVLPDHADREWVEDQLLEGNLRLAGAPAGEPVAADIISLAIQHFTGRQAVAAPTTGPAPKARLRA